MNYPKHLLKLIESLKKLPGVGSKSAERYAFELLKWKEADIGALATIIQQVPSQLKTCTECGALKGEEACNFCSHARSEPHKLCLLASPRDVYSIEGTREFKGYYHVLGGLISPLEGIGPESLNLDSLLKRIEKLGIEEIVIALDSTIEGDATALYLKKILADLPLKVTRLAFGIPMGSSIDYVDGGTLARAFADRFSF
jgi:recombination protein RecR